MGNSSCYNNSLQFAIYINVLTIDETVYYRSIILLI